MKHYEYRGASELWVFGFYTLSVHGFESHLNSMFGGSLLKYPRRQGGSWGRNLSQWPLTSPGPREGCDPLLLALIDPS